jgi:glucose/arabinose dehydrogenase
LAGASNLSIGDPFSINTTEYSDAACKQNTVPAALSIFPHSAPLGLKFYNPPQANLGDAYKGGAFMTYREFILRKLPKLKWR